jgi:hypothetical protein
MSNARQEILELVASGKISAAEAADMLSKEGTPKGDSQAENASKAPKEKSAPTESIADTATQGENDGQAGRWLRVRVSDLKSGKSRVRVNIPLRLVKVGLKMGRGFVPELEGVDWDDVESSIAGVAGGLLVDVEDEDSGEHVQVYVE